ncbi:MAG: phage tail protein [Candidatus Sedimenticola sp. 6PFRAG7]
MSSSYMMKLGEYSFSLNTAAYQSLTRSCEYRWRAQDRTGRSPAQQYLGPGAETISLEGDIYPHFKGGLGQLESMRSEAGKGVPMILVDGTGRIWQQWVIKQVEETQRLLFNDGTPSKIEFRMQLTRYGEDQ